MITMENQEKDKKSKLFLYIVIAALLVTNGLLLYQYYKNKGDNQTLTAQNTTLTEDQSRLNADLDNLAMELEQTKSSVMQRDDQISQLQTDLESKVSELRKQLNKGNLSAKEIASLKNQITALKQESMSLQNKISQLEQELAITTEKLTITTQNLDNEVINSQNLAADLTKKEEVISKGKQLIADQMTIVGIKRRNSGKEVETTRTRRVDEIKVSFRILENKIANQGDKPLYVKITGPNGVTLEPNNGEGVFSLSNGETAKFSVMKMIDYKNADMFVDVYHKKGSDYEAGIYTVEVFADKVSIGKSSVTLR